MFDWYDCLKNWTRDTLLLVYSLLLYQVQCVACAGGKLKRNRGKHEFNNNSDSRDPLALWQAHFVEAELKRHHPGIEVKLLGMTSRGDHFWISHCTKWVVRVFLLRTETALLDERADIAVHSMKDVPMELPPGLTLGVICEREDPRDALVGVTSFDDLPEGLDWAPQFAALVSGHAATT